MMAHSFSDSWHRRSFITKGTRVLMSSPRGRSTPESASKSEDLPWLWSPRTTMRVELISFSCVVSLLIWSFSSMRGRTQVLVSAASIFRNLRARRAGIVGHCATTYHVHEGVRARVGWSAAWRARGAVGRARVGTRAEAKRPCAAPRTSRYRVGRRRRRAACGTEGRARDARMCSRGRGACAAGRRAQRRA